MSYYTDNTLKSITLPGDYGDVNYLYSPAFGSLSARITDFGSTFLCF